jgi:hypothetical protein
MQAIQPTTIHHNPPLPVKPIHQCEYTLIHRHMHLQHIHHMFVTGKTTRFCGGRQSERSVDISRNRQRKDFSYPAAGIFSILQARMKLIVITACRLYIPFLFIYMCSGVQGFKVGGVDPGVPVRHGAAYGNGVYSATGPAIAMGYNGGNNRVILARALVGTQKQQPRADAETDSWVPQKDWMIFKSGQQILPCYVVYFT